MMRRVPNVIHFHAESKVISFPEGELLLSPASPLTSPGPLKVPKPQFPKPEDDGAENWPGYTTLRDSRPVAAQRYSWQPGMKQPR